MQNSEDYNSVKETITYSSGTSTEGSYEQQEVKVIGEVEIDKVYGIGKPTRKIIKAKIFLK